MMQWHRAGFAIRVTVPMSDELVAEVARRSGADPRSVIRWACGLPVRGHSLVERMQDAMLAILNGQGVEIERVE
jgi:hypothetical protein